MCGKYNFKSGAFVAGYVVSGTDEMDSTDLEWSVETASITNINS